MASDGEEICKMLNLTVTEDQRRAIRYLERQKQIFCAHFGYGNAVEKARDHWNGLRRKRYAKARR